MTTEWGKHRERKFLSWSVFYNIRTQHHPMKLTSSRFRTKKRKYFCIKLLINLSSVNINDNGYRNLYERVEILMNIQPELYLYGHCVKGGVCVCEEGRAAALPSSPFRHMSAFS